jgi:hypothetical protein
MQRDRQPARGDEPAVTFELEEAPRVQRRGQMGVAGAVGVAGAGLVSSAAMSEQGDSLDVFNLLGDVEEQSGEVPVTSFDDLTVAEPDSAFPPIEFADTTGLDVDAGVDGFDGTESMFGASAEVGGGFVLDDVTGAEAFGVPDIDIDIDIDIEPVSDSLLDVDDLGDDLDMDLDDPDELDPD